jgi:hypothetical protein
VPEKWDDKLVDLYRVAIEEYRYNVRLNWDRTQYFLGLNLAIVAAATGLLKAGQTTPLEYGLVGSLFICGMIASTVGADSAIKGHEYYRASRTVVKSFERRLKLPRRLRLASTQGMKRGVASAAAEPDLGLAGQPPEESRLAGNLRTGTVMHAP